MPQSASRPAGGYPKCAQGGQLQFPFVRNVCHMGNRCVPHPRSPHPCDAQPGACGYAVVCKNVDRGQRMCDAGQCGTAAHLGAILAGSKTTLAASPAALTNSPGWRNDEQRHHTLRVDGGAPDFYKGGSVRVTSHEMSDHSMDHRWLTLTVGARN